jgi:uncharacterized metal-binding protein
VTNPSDPRPETDDLEGGAPHETRRPSRRDQPVVYSCSGCSSAAQLANALAIRLDRAGVAEMSCIAGLGGDVAPLLRLARSGRPILALDGCPLVCVAATLRRHGLTPDGHVVLSDHGVRKRRHVDPDDGDLWRLWPLVTDAAQSCASSKPGVAGPGSRSLSGPAALPDA